VTNVDPNTNENQFVPATDINEDDVDLAAYLDDQELNKAHTLFGDKGIMNFEKMVKDGLLNVNKPQNGVPLEIDTYENHNSHSYGQIDKNNSMLSGIGRKVVKTEHYIHV